MSILTDLNAFLTANSITNIQYNHYDESASLVCLWVYGGEPIDVGQKPAVQIMVKNTNMLTAETTATTIYDLLFPKNQYSSQRYKVINNKRMFIEAVQQPFYLEKDDQNRHTYVFNILVVTQR